jgi:DHA1 family quinolone resistance protein-like MFS transporter
MKSTRQIQRVYYLILSLFWFAVGLPMSLSVLLAQARGLNLFEISLLLGVYSLTIVLLEVPTGGLADAIGRKKVTVMAYACSLLGSIVFLHTFSFPVALAAFVLNGIARALSSGALDAWFVDSLHAVDPQVDLQPALAKAGTFTLLALGSGALLGSAMPGLFAALPPDGTAVLTPLSIPLMLATCVQAVLLLATLLLVKETRPTGAAAGWKAGLRQVPDIIRTGVALSRHNPVLLRLLGASFVSGLVLISLEALWQPHFAVLLGGVENSLLLGLVMGGNFLAGMVGNQLATPLSRWLHERYGLVCAIFQGLRGVLLIALACQVQALPATLAFWLVYLNMAVVNSPHATLLNREIPAQQRSAMLSIESFVAYLGSVIGSTVLGYVAERLSIPAAWTIGGVVLVVSLGLYVQIDVKQRHLLGGPVRDGALN